ncbi:MAG: NAD(+)/NADH kinase [Clostridia bacterium]|nr:NAD(+)/NADH kinase [Clostridia bacterium]
MLIAVVPNQSKNENTELVRQVSLQLTKTGTDVRVVCAQGNVPTTNQLVQALEGCDAAVAIGGDGTIMHVAKAAAMVGCPVLGINGGRLGFLAGLEPEDLSRITRLTDGDYAVEQRALLEITVGDTTLTAMNEVVISRGSLSRLVDVTVHAGEQEILTCRGDGVIVATPTGSTAYSLSAGGPVVDPAVDCLLLTPVCPHSLDSRSRVLPADAVLTLQATVADGESAFITVDGEQNIPLTAFDRVTVRRAVATARLIRLGDTDFYDGLRHKLFDRR